MAKNNKYIHDVCLCECVRIERMANQTRCVLLNLMVMILMMIIIIQSYFFVPSPPGKYVSLSNDFVFFISLRVIQFKIKSMAAR